MIYNFVIFFMLSRMTINIPKFGLINDNSEWPYLGSTEDFQLNKLELFRPSLIKSHFPSRKSSDFVTSCNSILVVASSETEKNTPK